jgi:hypothetical protein
MIDIGVVAQLHAFITSEMMEVTEFYSILNRTEDNK